MHAGTAEIVMVGLCEIVALAAIIHLWFRKHDMLLITRLFWTIVLLVPLLGLLFYGFMRRDPPAHSDNVPDSSGGIDPGAH